MTFVARTCKSVSSFRAHDKSPYWCVGVKSKKQADEAKGVLGWRLSEDEVKALDRTSQVLGDGSLGAPFEQW